MRVCPKCGGRLSTGSREIAQELAGRRFVVTVSARNCGSCAMSYLDAASVEQGDLKVAAWLALYGPALGPALRAVRKALGARAVDVADLLGVTAETVSRWENEQRRVDRGAWIVLGSLLLEKADIAPRTRERLQAFIAPVARPRTVKLDARRVGRPPSSGQRLSAVDDRATPTRKAR